MSLDSSLKDKKLLYELSQGSELAFTELYNAYKNNIYATALKITKSKMERIANNANFQTLLVQKNAGLLTTQEMADQLNVPFSTLYSFLKNKK